MPLGSFGGTRLTINSQVSITKTGKQMSKDVFAFQPSGGNILKKSRRLMPPVLRFVLFASLALSAMMLGITGCGDDDDGGTNNGTGDINFCNPGESKYYCMATTVTFTPSVAKGVTFSPQITETFYGVENICVDDGEGVIDPSCDVKQSGSNFSITCAFTEEISATCTLKYDYTMSGTVTDNVIDLSGMATVTSQGECEPDVPTGTIEVAIHGDRVDGPSAPCGEGSGNGSFNLTVTKPGIVVSPALLSAQAFGDPTNGYTLLGTFSDDSNVSYTTSVLIPPVSSVPANFTIVDPDGSGPGEAEVIYIEAKLSTPVYAYNLTSASGTLTITKATDSEIAGSFSATGSGDVINGTQEDVEDRTLVGDFSSSVSGGPDMAGEFTPEMDISRYHRRMVRMVLQSIGASVERDGRGVVTP
jgi:hypothetical protein